MDNMDCIKLKIVVTFVISALLTGVKCQRLHQVQAEQIPPVRTETTARLRCSFIGDNITVQYVSWTKYTPDGKRSFVYEYSQHPPLARAYNDFIGRARITYADMNDNRYSYLNRRRNYQRRRIQKVVVKPTEPPQVLNDQQIIAIEDISDNDQNWSNMHESIYGVFSDSMKSGRKPDFSRIDRIFRGMDDKHNMAKQLKNLDIPVTRDDIKKIMLPLRSNGPITVPARLTPQNDVQIQGSERLTQTHFWDMKRRRKKRALTAHHIDLTLRHVLLTDEARYECLVKPINGPAMSSSMNIVVHVPPSKPSIETNRDSFSDGSNITITCRANVGKPAGSLSWARKRNGDSSFHELSDSDITSRNHMEANGTTYMARKLDLQLAAADDGAIYRCTSTSPILDSYEQRPFATTKLNVLYAPRGGRILFDTAVGRYYCHARGKPVPTYSWIWLRSDDKQTLMSKNRYLDLSGMRRSGYYRFHCLASNTINGIKHTKVMATRLRVIAPKSAGYPSMERNDIHKVTTTTTTTTTTKPPTTTPTTTTPPPTTTTPIVYQALPSYDSIERSFPESASRQLIPTLEVVESRQFSKDGYGQKAPDGLDNGEAENEDDYYYYYYYDTENKLLQPANHPAKLGHSLRNSQGTPAGYQIVNREKEDDKYMKPVTEKTPSTPKEVNRRLDGKSLDWYRFEDEAGQQVAGEDIPEIELEEKESETLPYDALGKNAEEVPFKKQPLFEVSLPDTTITRDQLPPRQQADFHRERFRGSESRWRENRPQDIPRRPTEATVKSISDIEESIHKGVFEEMHGKGHSARAQNRRERKRKYLHGSNHGDKEERGKRRRLVVPERKRQQRMEKKKVPKHKGQKPGNDYEKIRTLGPGDFDCSSRRSGIHRAGCRAFYRCVGDQGYFVECRQPYVYNKITEQCGDPKEAPAPCGKFRDCSQKPNRKFVDRERGCQYYYTCYMGFFMGHNECNPGLVFNEKEQLCDWPENLKGSCGQDKQRRKYSSKSKGRFAG